MMNEFRPSVEEPVSSDAVYERLRREIISGRYAPGARLVEERLAHDYGVSRTPIRQALARVAQEGLVRIFPHRGAVVRTFERADLLAAYDLRAVLEGFAAAQAATRISPMQLLVLEEADRALEASLSKQFASREAEVLYLVEHNQIFHSTIVAAAGNERLAALLPTVLDVPMQFRSFNWYTAEERRISNFFHRSIITALQHGNADRARSMMQEHIYRGRDVLLESLDR
jgi:DNA-binding GntR family transcriptional regulator